jgi:undecaprenyl-diphosphatase
MLDLLFQLDHDLLFWIFQHTQSSWMDWIMAVCSNFHVNIWLIVPMLTVILYQYRQSALPFFAVSLICILIGDSLIGHSLKKNINRIRPRDQTENYAYVDLAEAKYPVLRLLKTPVRQSTVIKPKNEKGSSFPSNHTINLFGIAWVGFHFFRRLFFLFYSLAFLVALSRLYVLAHWPSDVLASAFIGSFSAWLTLRLYCLLIPLVQQKFTKINAL